MDPTSQIADRARSPAWLRWSQIALRTAHIVAITFLVGGHVWSAPREALVPWLGVTLMTGLALIASYLVESREFLAQVRGLVVGAKLVPVLLVPVIWEHRAWLLGAAIVLSSVIAHAPGKLRKTRVWRGRRSGSGWGVETESSRGGTGRA